MWNIPYSPDYHQYPHVSLSETPRISHMIISFLLSVNIKYSVYLILSSPSSYQLIWNTPVYPRLSSASSCQFIRNTLYIPNHHKPPRVSWCESPRISQIIIRFLVSVYQKPPVYPRLSLASSTFLFCYSSEDDHWRESPHQGTEPKVDRVIQDKVPNHCVVNRTARH